MMLVMVERQYLDNSTGKSIIVKFKNKIDMLRMTDIFTKVKNIVFKVLSNVSNLIKLS